MEDGRASQRRRAIVTGAGSGIGRATAVALAAAGYDLVLAARRLPPLERTAGECGEAGARCLAVRCDVTDEQAVRGLSREARELFGGLELLVNNAGRAHFSRLEHTSLGDWREVIDTNLTGPFLLSRELLPLLRAGDEPVIVNVASTLGLTGLAEAGAYCASKAALVNLTRVLALELAGEGMRAVAVCPAVVDTPMIETVRGDDLGTAARRERLDRLHPIGRIARPAEIAETIVFLAGSRASFVSGSVVTIDGGQLAGFHH